MYADPWPPLRGDYIVGNRECGVAVVTLGSTLPVRGSAIIGPCKTENLGVEKIIANVISNCNIRFLIICGIESKGHLPGNTLLALHKNGIDEQGRIIGSMGAIPFIQNLSIDAVCRFQDQITLIDRIGLEDTESIEELVREYNSISHPYPAEPFLAVKAVPVHRVVVAGQSDLYFGCGVQMDTVNWLVLEA